MKTSKILLFVFFFVFISRGFGQPVSNFRTPNPSFKEIRDSFNAYWDARPIESGKGYKPFKRWEWYWETRLLPDGSFPSPSINADNLETYKRQQPLFQNRISSAANWESVGPDYSAGGYYGIGRINCIAFHPTNPNIFWAGTPAGGIWKTIDGGLSWSNNPYELQYLSLGVSDIAVNPINPNIIYIATGDGDVGSLSGATGGAVGDTKSIGILKSTDGGTTWQTTGMNWSLTAAKLIRRLIINPTNPNILIAATSDGIWRTTNAGANWNQVQSGYFMDVEFKPTDPSVLYAATAAINSYPYFSGIYRSGNNGTSWDLITELENVIRVNLAVSPAWPELVDAVAVNTASGLNGLWFSSNSGNTFSQYLTSDCTNNMLNGSFNGAGCGGQGHYDLAYAINPNDAAEIWLGGINTWRSTNGGSIWALNNFWIPNPTYNPENKPVVHADKHFIAFHPLLPNTVFECNDGGLYKTSNGGATWFDLTDGIVSSQIYRIGVSQTINNRVINGLQDNGTKEFSNSNWGDRTGGDGMSCAIDYTNSNIQYSSIQNGGGIYRTINGWTSVTNISLPLNVLLPSEISDNKPSGAWVTPFVIDPTNPSVLYAGYKRIYKSTNQGNTWQPISTVLNSDNLNLQHIAIAKSNSSVIYAATINTLYRSLNGGGSWLAVDTVDSVSITGIVVSPTDPLIMYITLSGYSSNKKVYKSVTGGSSWINYSYTLPNVSVNCMVYEDGSDEGLYVGTDVGVFYTNANLSDWIAYQTDLPHVVVTDLEISYYDSKLWAGTFGRGLWSTDLYVPPYIPIITPSADTSICQGQQLTLSAPTGFALYQWNNGASTQSIQVTQTGNYSVRVTDSQGNLSDWSDTITVTVEMPPSIPVISHQYTNNNCIGQSLVLNSSSAPFYQWYRNDTLILNATNQTYQPSINASYRVKVFSPNRACSTLSDTVMVNLADLNVTGLIQQDTIRTCGVDSVLLNAGLGYNSYLWSNGATTASIYVRTSGNYSVQANCGSNIYNSRYFSTNYNSSPKPYATIPNANQYSFTNNMSIIFRMRMENVPNSGNVILEKGNNGASFRFSVPSYPFLKFSYPGIGNPNGLNGQISQWNWAWVAVVKTADSVFLYINNTIVDRAFSPNPIPITSSEIRLGKSILQEWDYFSGSVDQLSFWNRSLTASEISNYQNCMVGMELGCVGFYNFDQNLIGSFPDISTYGNTAINNGGAGSHLVYNSPILTCSSTVITDSVYVNLIKTKILQNDTTICKGSSILLNIDSLSNGQTVSWSTGATTNSITVTPIQATTYFVTISDGINLCTDSVRVNVVALDTSLTLLDNPMICVSGGQVRMQAGVASIYQWLKNGIAIPNATQRFYNATATGAYRVALTNSLGCRDTSRVVQVTLYPQPVVSFTVNNAGQCLTGNNFVFTNNSTISSGTLVYQWYFGDGSSVTTTNATHTYSTAGTYIVKLVTTSNNSCKDSTTQIVVVYPMPSGSISVPTTTIICDGSTITLSATGGNTYQWYLNGQPIAGATTSSIAASQPGVYSVELITTNNCRNMATNSIQLTLVKIPIVDFSFDKYCAGFPVNFTNLSNISVSGTVSYTWTFGNGGISTQTNSVHVYQQSGNYNVTLTVMPVACPLLSASKIKTIAIIAPPANLRNEPVNAVQNRDLQLQHRLFSGSSYLWVPTTGLNNPTISNPVFNYNQQQEFLIKISTTQGCIITDTILVRMFKERNIYLPGGFTPNGDGKNDQMIPRLVGIQKLVFFKVYDRWGQLMFQTNVERKGWDGYFKGTKQPIETYSWVAEGIDIDGKVLRVTGNTVLLQ